jgi:hypothetical protein
MTTTKEHDKLIDPQFERLLDEALDPQSVPGGVPAGLVDRVYGRTVRFLPSPAAWIVGRIGLQPALATAAAVAAVFVAALSIAVWIGGSDGGTLRGQVVMADREAHDEALERDMQMLALDLEDFEMGAPRRSMQDGLDDAMRQWEELDLITEYF